MTQTVGAHNGTANHAIPIDRVTGIKVPRGGYKDVSGGQSAFTEGLVESCVVATYNRLTRRITLHHAAHCLVKEGYYARIAQIVDSNTLVVIANGYHTRNTIWGYHYMAIKARISAAVTEARTGARVSFVNYYTNPDTPVASTFVMRSDGQYKRISNTTPYLKALAPLPRVRQKYKPPPKTSAAQEKKKTQGPQQQHNPYNSQFQQTQQKARPEKPGQPPKKPAKKLSRSRRFWAMITCAG